MFALKKNNSWNFLYYATQAMVSVCGLVVGVNIRDAGNAAKPRIIDYNVQISSESDTRVSYNTGDHVFSSLWQVIAGV